MEAAMEVFTSVPNGATTVAQRSMPTGTVFTRRLRSVERDAQQAPAAPSATHGYRAVWNSTIGMFTFVPSSAPAHPGPAQQHLEAMERKMLDAEERTIEERMAEFPGRLDEIRGRHQELDQQEQDIESETKEAPG